MDGVATPGPGSHLFLQVQDPFPVGIIDAVGVPVLQGLFEEALVFAGGEFVEAVPVGGGIVPDHIELAHMAPVLADHNRELPALDLEDDAHGLDAPLVALGDEFGVVHEAVETEPGVQLAEGFVLQVGQADGAAAQDGPDQEGRLVGFQVFHHPHGAEGEAGVVAMTTRMPSVKIDASFHKESFLSEVYSPYIRSISD